MNERNFNSFNVDSNGMRSTNNSELNDNELITRNNIEKEKLRQQKLRQERIKQEQARERQKKPHINNKSNELSDNDILKRKPIQAKSPIEKKQTPTDEVFYIKQNKEPPKKHVAKKVQQTKTYNHPIQKPNSINIIKAAKNIMDASVEGKPCLVNAQTAVISVKKAKRNVAVMCLVCTIIGGSLGLIGKNQLNKTKNDYYIDDLKKDFKTTAVEPNTKRTIDGENYYYEYDEIYKEMLNSDKSYDMEVYLAYKILGEYQMNRLFSDGAKMSAYRMDDYVKEKGYKSIKEWEEGFEQEIILRKEIAEKEEELQKMTNEIDNKYAIQENYGDNYGK